MTTRGELANLIGVVMPEVRREGKSTRIKHSDDVHVASHGLDDVHDRQH